MHTGISKFLRNSVVRKPAAPAPFQGTLKNSPCLDPLPHNPYTKSFQSLVKCRFHCSLCGPPHTSRTLKGRVHETPPLPSTPLPRTHPLIIPNQTSPPGFPRQFSTSLFTFFNCGSCRDGIYDWSKDSAYGASASIPGTTLTPKSLKMGPRALSGVAYIDKIVAHTDWC